MIMVLLFFFLIDNDDRYLIPLFISRLHNQLTSLKMNMESIFTDKGKNLCATLSILLPPYKEGKLGCHFII